jgi:XrtJ-associated TM-motif-TM protein
MNKVAKTCLLTLAVLSVPALALAQTGCVNSPENPTVVLAVVGGAACGWRSIRAAIARKRNNN